MENFSQKLACELIGAFALTFIGAGAIITSTWTGGQPDLVGIALAHGIILSIVVTATMNLSGGHINPAVTAAMVATGRMKVGPALGYVIAQCVGAVLAGFLLSMIFNGVHSVDGRISGAVAIAKCKLGTPNFDPMILSAGWAVTIEASLTFLLVYAIYGTAVDGRSPRIAGFGIGMTVCVDILMGGPLTGAAMNPARTIGTLIGGGSATSSLWSQHWVYWIGPILGAVLGAFAYEGLILRQRRS